MMLLKRASPAAAAAAVLALLASTPVALAAPLVEEGSSAPQCPSVKEAFSVWPMAEAGTVVPGKCWSQEYTGNPTRECLPDGTWGPIQNPCALNTEVCPPLPYASTSIFPQTPVNTLAQGSCIDGFVGNPTRFCNADGTWGPESGSCERLLCQEEVLAGNTWPETPADGLAALPCPEGTEGTLFRTCGSDGAWMAVEGACAVPQQTLSCPEQVYGTATFPATAAGETATGVCKEGWTGAPRRICKPDGKWQSLVQKHCRLELRVCGSTARADV